MYTVRAEIYFRYIDALDRFIENMQYERDLWEKEMEKKGKTEIGESK